MSVPTPGRTPDRLAAALEAVGARLTELARSTPRALPSFRPRRRRVTLTLGPWLPGWALRLITVGLVVLAAVAAGGGPALVTAGGVLALGMAARPGGSLPVVVVGYVGFVLLTTGGMAWRPGAFVALAATHLMVQLAAVLGRSGLAAHVELAALGPPLRRWLPVQLAAQLLALLGAVVSQGGLELPWLAPVAVVAVGGLVVGLRRRLAETPGG